MRTNILKKTTEFKLRVKKFAAKIHCEEAENNLNGRTGTEANESLAVNG